MDKARTLWDSVGRTPLIRIKSLSEKTGCEIYGKAEFLNPGGSVKDRAAKGIIAKAEREGKLSAKKPVIVEGTAGNTGIGLATLAPERGYQVVVFMPNNQAAEKHQMLEALGAEVRRVPPCPFANQDHFYHRARRYSEEHGVAWADQFENTANAQVHYDSTGPEIMEQLDGKLDVFVTACGTGGTIGGVTAYLKECNNNILTIAADPVGSGVHDYFKTGAFTGEGGSITEGIGIKRLTANLARAVVDDAMRITDKEMIDMLFHVTRHDGLFMGTSAALNLYGAYKTALRFQGSGKRIVTLLCDSGSRYASKLLDESWLKEKELIPDPLSH